MRSFLVLVERATDMHLRSALRLQLCSMKVLECICCIGKEYTRCNALATCMQASSQAAPVHIRCNSNDCISGQ